MDFEEPIFFFLIWELSSVLRVIKFTEKQKNTFRESRLSLLWHSFTRLYSKVLEWFSLCIYKFLTKVTKHVSSNIRRPDP